MKVILQLLRLVVLMVLLPPCYGASAEQESKVEETKKPLVVKAITSKEEAYVNAYNKAKAEGANEDSAAAIASASADAYLKEAIETAKRCIKAGIKTEEIVELTPSLSIEEIDASRVTSTK